MNFTSETETVPGCGEYPIQVRRWCPDNETIEAQVMILHGVVSHSDWLRPIAEQLAKENIEVICPDRRGAGLNTVGSGDAEDADTLVRDINIVLQYYSRPDIPLHIAGFCWGATYAICCAENYPSAFRSLILIAPSIFPADDLARRQIVTGDSPDATEEPLVPVDRFTSGIAYENYIVPDTLRTRAVSPRFNSIMVKMTSMVAPRWARLTLPILMIMASDDRLANNEKHEKAFGILRARPKRKVTIVGEHGLQFDAPEETANEIDQWLKSTEFSGKK